MTMVIISYLIFKLRHNIQLCKKTKMIITLFISNSIDHTIFLRAPTLLTSIVDFDIIIIFIIPLVLIRD